MIPPSMVSGNEAFIRCLGEAVGTERVPVVLAALNEAPSVSVRRNPFKDKASFPGSRPVPWSEYGLMLSDRPAFTLDPLFHAGCYYVQDSSSMFIGSVLRRILGGLPDGTASGSCLRVLDLCAAPGGKTTDAAASLRQALGDGFLLVANEVIRSRASVLASNAALWGDPNVVVTSSDPSGFAALPGFFDIVLADVPCSGEGMFRKDETAVRQWSEDNVALCSARQKRILADVWPALADGGILIYSTCTFNRYENDCNAAWAAENLGAEILGDEIPGAGSVPENVIRTEHGYSLLPGFVEGEGQYCSVLRKKGNAGGREPLDRPVRHGSVWRDSRNAAGKDRGSGILCAGDYFAIPVRTEVKNGMVKAVPESIAEDVGMLERTLKVISSGCAVGMLKGRDMVPDADLALNIMLERDAFPRAEADLETALKFLHRDSFALPDAGKGYVLLCYRDVPLGFVKNLGNRCNNLHPAGRRIRMDVGIPR